MKRLTLVLNYSAFYPGHQPPEVPLEVIKGYDLEFVILTIVRLRTLWTGTATSLQTKPSKIPDNSNILSNAILLS